MIFPYSSEQNYGTFQPNQFISFNLAYSSKIPALVIRTRTSVEWKMSPKMIPSVRHARGTTAILVFVVPVRRTTGKAQNGNINGSSNGPILFGSADSAQRSMTASRNEHECS